MDIPFTVAIRFFHSLLSPVPSKLRMVNKPLLFSLPLLISLLEAFFRFQTGLYDIHTGHQVDLDYLNWF
jgi:hypothetical protein